MEQYLLKYFLFKMMKIGLDYIPFPEISILVRIICFYLPTVLYTNKSMFVIKALFARFFHIYINALLGSLETEYYYIQM